MRRLSIDIGGPLPIFWFTTITGEITVEPPRVQPPDLEALQKCLFVGFYWALRSSS